MGPRKQICEGEKAEGRSDGTRLSSVWSSPLVTSWGGAFGAAAPPRSRLGWARGMGREGWGYSACRGERLVVFCGVFSREHTSV